MTDQRPITPVRRLFSLVVLLSLLSSQLAAAAVPISHATTTPAGQETQSSAAGAEGDVLFRTRVTLRHSQDLERIQSWGSVVLEQGEEWALLLVTSSQLEQLARLRFNPSTTDGLTRLSKAQTEDTAWLWQGLQPVLKQASTIQQQLTAQRLTETEANERLNSLLATITSEQKAALTTVSSVDFDGDGLTDTEELWWCTDPQNQNSDGDAQGYTDSEEINALLDFTLPRSTRWGYGPPFGPPNAWPDWNNSDGYNDPQKLDHRLRWIGGLRYNPKNPVEELEWSKNAERIIINSSSKWPWKQARVSKHSMKSPASMACIPTRSANGKSNC